MNIKYQLSMMKYSDSLLRKGAKNRRRKALSPLWCFLDLLSSQYCLVIIAHCQFALGINNCLLPIVNCPLTISPYSPINTRRESRSVGLLSSIKYAEVGR